MQPAAEIATTHRHLTNKSLPMDSASSASPGKTFYFSASEIGPSILVMDGQSTDQLADFGH